MAVKEKAYSFTISPCFILQGDVLDCVEISLGESEIDTCSRWFSMRDNRWIHFVPEAFHNHDPTLFDKLYGSLYGCLSEEYVSDNVFLCWPEELLQEIGVKFPNLSLWVCDNRSRNPLVDGGGLPIHIREELLPVIRGILTRVKDPDNPMAISLDSLRGEYPGPVDEIEREARCYLEDYAGWEGKNLCFYLSKLSLCD